MALDHLIGVRIPVSQPTLFLLFQLILLKIITIDIRQKMEPERLFSLTWHPYSVDPKIDYSKETPTLVEFRLEKTTSGTLLLLTESGFDKIPSDRRIEAFRMNDGGWTEQMKNIDNHVSQTS